MNDGDWGDDPRGAYPGNPVTVTDFYVSDVDIVIDTD